MALVVLAATTFAVRELWRRRGTPTVGEALKVGESKTVEFKSVYQWDPDRGEAIPDKRLVILRAIIGFLNADGGTLYISVGEDQSGRPYVCGIEKDLEIFEGNMNELRRNLIQLVASRVGSQFSLCIADHVETVGDDVCWIIFVQRAPKPAFVH
jgi:predicted HTH transcriptional regulator